MIPRISLSLILFAISLACFGQQPPKTQDVPGNVRCIATAPVNEQFYCYKVLEDTVDEYTRIPLPEQSGAGKGTEVQNRKAAASIAEGVRKYGKSHSHKPKKE